MFELLVSMLRLSVFGSKNATDEAFDPATAVPSLEGQTVLVTGGAAGLGREFALELARHGRPKRLYILDLPRPDDGQKVRDDMGAAAPCVDVRFVGVDLGSFASIRDAAAQCTSSEAGADERLDIVVFNAGIISTKPGLSQHGYEKHFGINYLGHALLAKLLAPTLLRTAALPGARVRVVVVSSEAHVLVPRGGILFDRLKTPCEELTYFQRYGQSKLGCVLLARELARTYPSLVTASVHPGRVQTGLADVIASESLLARLASPFAGFIVSSVACGVKNHLWAATSPDVVSGAYYEPVGVSGRESDAAKDGHLSRKLWAWTEKELGPWLPASAS